MLATKIYFAFSRLSTPNARPSSFRSRLIPQLPSVVVILGINIFGVLLRRLVIKAHNAAFSPTLPRLLDCNVGRKRRNPMSAIIHRPRLYAVPSDLAAIVIRHVPSRVQDCI